MRVVAGAILILAGAVLVAATVLAEAISREPRYLGYYLGASAAVAGALVMVSRLIRRAWDAIPVEPKATSREGR